VLRWEDPREKRLRALRDLAASASHPGAHPTGETPATVPESLAPPKPRAHRSRWLIAVAGLVCVAIIAIVAIRALSIGQPDARLAVSFAKPGADGLTCPVDVRWSPRGDRIAVLGYAGSCPSATTSGNVRASAVVLIYDARTMKLAKRLHPDDLIVSSHLREGDSATTNSTPPPVVYRSIIWSRDGTLLALPFDVISQQGTAGLPVPDDVLLTDLNGSYDAITGNVGHADVPGGEVLWDMRQGGATSGNNFLIPPPALAYAWQQNDVLTAQNRLDNGQPIVAPPLAPIGNPYADPTFTAWQPGFIFVLPPDVSNPSGPNTWKYYAAYGAMTPDGQYLIAPIIHRYNVAPPGQPGGTDTNVPTLPLRDAALRAVFGAATASQNTGGSGTANVAWRPNGRVLAAQLIPAGDTTPAHHAVIIYACATGKIVAALTPLADAAHALSAPASDAFAPLQWSPDGTHLLLLDPALGTLTVWGPTQLPR
jgi:hypothetical protein